MFRAFSYGGTSLATDADYVPASTAAQVVAAGGLGPLSSVNLRKALTGIVASAQPTIGSYEEGLSGGGSPKDLETLFQLIHLRFTQPRADAEIFGVMREQTKAALANQTATPGFAFQEALNGALTQNHLRAPHHDAGARRRDEPRQVAGVLPRPLRRRERLHVRLRRHVRSRRHAAARRAIPREPARDSSSGNLEGRRDATAKLSVVTRAVAKGIEPRSQTQIVFTGPFQNDQAHRIAHSRHGYRAPARGYATSCARISAAPTRSALRRTTRGFRGRNTPSPSDSAATRAARTRLFETRVPGNRGLQSQTARRRRSGRRARGAEARVRDRHARQNGYLLTNIAGRYQSGESVEEFFRLAEAFDRSRPRRSRRGEGLPEARPLRASVDARCRNGR